MSSRLSRFGRPAEPAQFRKNGCMTGRIHCWKDLDDLYALLDKGFLDEDVDFEKELAALVIAESHEANFCCDECSKVC